MDTQSFITNFVHASYWEHDVNCARTTLGALAHLSGILLAEQTLQAAIGLHGAGGFRAQCGLVEGTLMFLGIDGAQRGMSEHDIADRCRRFAEAFTATFSSLRCCDLRPGGFTENDPPHACETLTDQAIDFAWAFISRENKIPVK